MRKGNCLYIKFMLCISMVMYLLYCKESYYAAQEYQLSATVKATVSDDGKTLTISGTGEIPEVAAIVPNTNNIQKVIIENGIERIGDDAFHNMKLNLTTKSLWDNLESVVMADSVREIGSFAFADDKKLSSVRWSNNLESIESYAFYCTGLKELILPKGVKKIEHQAFEFSKDLRRVVIPEGITELEDRMFYDCEGLKEVVLPNSLKEIGYAVFSFCYSLEKIEIPDSVEKLGSNTFTKCINLKEVKLPNGLDTISYRQFEGCENLKTFTIPASVKTIESCAFMCCEQLEIITIPSNVTTIEEDVFYECSKLKTIKGEAGSYAEQYAKQNGYRFDDGTKPEYTYEEYNKTMYVKSQVNVRDLPTTDGEKLGTLSAGNTVEVTGKCKETGWYRIKFGSSIGYVSNEYLSDTPIEEEEDFTPSQSGTTTPSMGESEIEDIINPSESETEGVTSTPSESETGDITPEPSENGTEDITPDLSEREMENATQAPNENETGDINSTENEFSDAISTENQGDILEKDGTDLDIRTIVGILCGIIIFVSVICVGCVLYKNKKNY